MMGELVIRYCVRSKGNIDIFPLFILAWDSHNEMKKGEVTDENQKSQSSEDYRVTDY
jgi:hypothetical protein